MMTNIIRNELEQSSNRKLNLIVFGVHEERLDSLDERKERDENNIDDIQSELDYDSERIQTICRIGK